MINFLDRLIYWWYSQNVEHHCYRVVFIFSSLFVIPVMIYSLVNMWIWGVPITMMLWAGVGLGWLMQDATQPPDRHSGGGALPGG